jgi:hypothetical protein
MTLAENKSYIFETDSFHFDYYSMIDLKEIKTEYIFSEMYHVVTVNTVIEDLSIKKLTKLTTSPMVCSVSQQYNLSDRYHEVECQIRLAIQIILAVNTMIFYTKIARMADIKNRAMPTNITPDERLICLVGYLAIIEDILNKKNVVFPNKLDFLHKFRKKTFYAMSLLVNPREFHVWASTMLSGGQRTLCVDTEIYILHFLCKAYDRVLQHYCKFTNYTVKGKFEMPKDSNEAQTKILYPSSVLEGKPDPKIQELIKRLLKQV